MYNICMNALTITLVAFGVISLIVASVYLYIFELSKERFIRFWGLCWLCYSCSILLLILGNTSSLWCLPVLRKMFDIANILFLLFGVYCYQNIRIPGYWTRFSLYMVIWGTLSIIYHFELMSFYIPTSTYQVSMTIAIMIIVSTKWNVTYFEKLAAILVFAVWGLGKSAVSILEILHPENMQYLYLAEVIFSNILNFTVVVLYLRKAEEKARYAEKQFKLIAENARDIIFFYQINPFDFTYITPSVETVLGYSPQDFYNDKDFLKQITKEEDAHKIDQLFNTASENDSNYATVKMVLKNSQIIWAEINTSLVYEEGLPIAWEGVIRDITATKNAEEQMVSSQKAKEVFLSYITHELKTPITSLLAYISALQEDTFESEDDKKEALEIIYKKSLTLERLINDLFQLSKLETRQFSFHFMVVEAHEFARELIDQHSLELENNGLRLVVKHDKALMTGSSLIVDPERIHQVFTNILTNAMRFSPKGGTIRISFSIDEKNKCFRMSIRDYGPGIAQKDVPYIFDRFYRVNRGEQSAREDTSGLGMTISKEIVNAHGGTISLKSHLPRGTTFIVTLPLYFEDRQ